jgi:hypothetical protein
LNENFIQSPWFSNMNIAHDQSSIPVLQLCNRQNDLPFLVIADACRKTLPSGPVVISTPGVNP